MTKRPNFNTRSKVKKQENTRNISKSIIIQVMVFATLLFLIIVESSFRPPSADKLLLARFWIFMRKKSGKKIAVQSH